jgi:hypothetical protein
LALNTFQFIPRIRPLGARLLRETTTMLIRYGYEITVYCQQPTAMVTLLGLRDGREADVRIAESFFTTPPVESATYRDMFDNPCRRFVAPAGA